MTLTLDEMKANRRKWIEALRSGEYKQGKNHLKSGDSYCCLGVLSVLAGAKTEGTHPSREARDWVGLTDTSGSFKGTCLVNINDDGMPFPEIANIIESEPPGLFIEHSTGA